ASVGDDRRRDQLREVLRIGYLQYRLAVTLAEVQRDDGHAVADGRAPFPGGSVHLAVADAGGAEPYRLGVVIGCHHGIRSLVGGSALVTQCSCSGRCSLQKVKK